MAMRLVALALLLGSSAAYAFDSTKVGQWGSLYLDDLLPVLAESAQLKQEVTVALAEKNKKPEDILCFGMRFPGAWKNLGGTRVAPLHLRLQQQISSHRRHRSRDRPPRSDLRGNQ